MFGEVGSSRINRWVRSKPERVYSTHVASRICSNLLKTNDGRHVYSSRNREDDFLAFFAKPIGSKLARESRRQESRSRCLANRSR